MSENDKVTRPAADAGRRKLIKTLASLPISYTGSLSAIVQARAEASGQPPLSSPGIKTETGQAIYSFPRDRARHGGKFYKPEIKSNSRSLGRAL